MKGKSLELTFEKTVIGFTFSETINILKILLLSLYNQSNMNYQETINFLYTQLPIYQRVGKSAFKKDLTNIIKLCKLLGNPEKKFKSIHIAGTNGKGTTAHILTSIFQESGYKTGLYTSPHLKSYTERIKIDGIEIDKQFVIGFVNKIRQEIMYIQPSFFEITVVMAFVYFSYQKIDIAIIETGLGGRLDSTNIITPELSIITNIALDHQHILGETIKEIASEKAGIIKNNIPVILGNMSNEACKVIIKNALDKGIKGNDNFKKYKIEKSNQNGYDVYFDDKLIIENLQSSIKGSYIAKNIPHIMESVKELNLLGYHIDEDKIRLGFEKVITNTGLKGRWQIIDKRPLIICDIAHNEDGIKQILNQIQETNYKKLHFVFGTVADKIIEYILQLLPKDAQYYFCAADIPRALNIDILYTKAVKVGLIGECFSSVNKAITAAEINAKKDDLIFIGGSTFVVAEIENL